MGYTTDFSGRIDLDKKLAPEHLDYLQRFSSTRRMWRDAADAEKLPDPARLAVKLPIGEEGAFYVGSDVENFGQDHDASIVDYNDAPLSQPGLWCKWTPTEDAQGLEWSGAEKFYDYVTWMRYLIDNFLAPWGYVANGRITWQGEDRSDKGTLIVKNNKVSTSPKKAEPGPDSAANWLNNDRKNRRTDPVAIANMRSVWTNAYKARQKGHENGN